MIKFKSYESFLIFSSNISLKDLNLLSLYYKEKLKNWGGQRINAKIYFLNSSYISILGQNNTLIFCLKITFNLLSFNIKLFQKLLKLNLKLQKYLILNI